MITFERMKEISPLFATKSDEELAIIRAEMYAFGQLALRAYNLEKVPKYPIGLVAKEDEIGLINSHE